MLINNPYTVESIAETAPGSHPNLTKKAPKSHSKSILIRPGKGDKVYTSRKAEEVLPEKQARAFYV